MSQISRSTCRRLRVLFSMLHGLAFLNLLYVAACTESAEHGNPLDPESPLFTTKGNIGGRVTTLYRPYQPLVEATVELQPGGLFEQSNAEGRFEFTGLDPDTFALTVTAAGYQDTSTTVVVLPRQTIPIEIRLNGLPVIQSQLVTSARVTTREDTTARFFLEIFAEVSDPDGANDIKKVEIAIPAWSFVDTLAPATGVGRWQRLFRSEELSKLDISKLVGSPFHIVVHDFPGITVTSEAFFLARIISETPEPISPVNGAVTGDTPTFRWQEPQIGFSFTHRIEIFRLDAGFPAFVSAVSNIKPDRRSSLYVGRLSAGTYFWTIKIIDDFGNSSRSKEATFQVQ